MLKDYQKRLLELFETMEMEIANLYKLFIEKFPSHDDLWSDLYNGEIKKVDYIKQLSSFAEEGKVFFDEKTTKTYTVKTIIDDIKSRYEKTLDNQYTIVNVLSFINSLEQSYVKNKFYDYFSSKDINTITMIKKMKEETVQHASKIKKALEEENFRF